MLASLVLAALAAWPSPARAADASLPRPATFAEVPALNMSYADPGVAARTVTILGSSKTTPELGAHVQMAGEVAGTLVTRGYNVLTGCGNAGIMGAAYEGAAAAAARPEARGENLAIVVEPAWGDENLRDARAIGKADSESARLEKFHQVSDHFLVFPGGPATLQEATALISKNHYRGSAPAKRIFLVGRAYFAGLLRQYEQMHAAGLLKTPPERLFQVVDTAPEALAHFPAAAPL